MNVGGETRQNAVGRQQQGEQTRHRTASGRLSSVPAHLLCGLVLIGIAWPIAWFGPSPISDHSFFPLWLGFILTVDGIVKIRTGSSPATREPRAFVALFLFSMPVWWLFEGANHFLGNWEYIPARDYGFVVHHLLASVAFSVVIPAIFVTSELYKSTRLGGMLKQWVRIRPSREGLIAISFGGALVMTFSLAFPSAAFPLVWLGLFFMLDPLNQLLGRPSISAQVATGRWNTVVVLFAASLTCGFFWELWNYWSLPKWVYHIPVASRPKIFEMPLLGYGGYLPFGLEIYALYQFMTALRTWDRGKLLRFDRAEDPPPGPPDA